MLASPASKIINSGPVLFISIPSILPSPVYIQTDVSLMNIDAEIFNKILAN